MDVPFEADDTGDNEARTDGGDSQGALAWAGEAAENRVDQHVLDRLPGRMAFTAGAAAGSVVTLLLVATYAFYF